MTVTVTVSVTVMMSFEVNQSSGGLSTYMGNTKTKNGAKKSMSNYSQWTRNFVPCEKWDSPKVQKMTHIAKFDHHDMLALWVKVIWAKVSGI